jgi:NTP pyrophosphatase (non-canonical NTP hydrolase)
MRRKLRENRYKGGWRDEDMDFLLTKLEEEVGELLEVVRAGNQDKLAVQDALDEAADVANMAMMIADRFSIRAPRGAADATGTP